MALKYTSTFFFCATISWASIASSATDTYYDELLRELNLMEGFPNQSITSSEQQFEVSDNSSLISRYDQAMNKIINVLPDSSFKNGLQKYLSIINARTYGSSDLSVGTNNSGIVAHNVNNIKNNPCFAKLAEAFYEDLRRSENLGAKPIFPNPRNKKPMGGRASLATESGSGDYAGLYPGWLFDKAMTYSGGNANLAMSLINLCGHDDVQQGPLNYSKASSSRAAQGNRIAEYSTAIDYAISKTKDLEQIKKLSDFKESLNSGKVVVPAIVKRSIQCPGKNSPFYLSKALGEEVDLSEDYKNRIAAIQAPNKGRAYLPSKNYHIMASAYMACNLIGEGVSPQLAAKIQGLAGLTYRTVRISSMIESDLKEAKRIDRAYQDFVVEYQMKHRQPNNKSDYPQVIPAQPPLIEQWIFYTQKENGKIFNSNKFKNIEEVKKYLAKYDAAKVLDRMTLGGEIMGIKIPHTNIVFGFQGDPIKRQVELVERRKGQRDDSFANDKSRYDRALEKALTYLIDWDWTYQQHLLGGEFAAKNCHQLKNKKELEHDACKSFDNQPGITCSVDYDSESKVVTSPFNSNFGTVFNALKASSETLQKEVLAPKLKAHNGQFEGLW